MVAVVARVEAAGGIGTLEARGMYMSSVVAVGKGIPITLPVLTTTPSRLAPYWSSTVPREPLARQPPQQAFGSLMGRSATEVTRSFSAAV